MHKPVRSGVTQPGQSQISDRHLKSTEPFAGLRVYATQSGTHRESCLPDRALHTMPIPLVSICIPAFRAEKYLELTLKSVAAQTVSNWEVIVTEDGSKDRVEEIARAFAGEVTQTVIYNRHASNRGLPATRNSGIAAARGTWIAFLDADDIWRPTHLETLLAAVQNTPCDLAFSGTEWFEDGSEKVLHTSMPTPEDLKNLPVALYSGRLSVLPSSVILRRECFDRFGPVSDEFPRVNDTEYWLRVLRNGGRIAYSGAVTCLYRQHATAMSKGAAEMLAESALLCERYADWRAIPAAIKRQRPASLYRWAARSLMPQDPRGASKILHRALRLQPLNLKTLGLLAKLAFHGRRAPA
jgi:Glycosyl transferase family 2